MSPLSSQASPLLPSIFEAPPKRPIPIVRAWFDEAVKLNVLDPATLALATTGANGLSSNRMVHMLEIRDNDIVFTTHAQSQKGRDIAATGWASGVLYWRETKQQIVVAGPVAPLSAQESDVLWTKRPLEANSMSTVSRQSETLSDEQHLRTQAQRLANATVPLPRPGGWHGYALRPSMVEFWVAAADRLHSRLRYEENLSGWTHRRLQP